MSTYGEKHSIYRNGGCYCGECDNYDRDEGICREWGRYTGSEEFCSRGVLAEDVWGVDRDDVYRPQ